MHFAATVFQALVFQAQDIVKRTTLGTHREPGRPVFVATTLTLKIIKKNNRRSSIAWRHCLPLSGFEVIHENLQQQRGIVTSCQVQLSVDLG